MVLPRIAQTDFSMSPVVVIWETTRACALKCVHCRAEAVDQRSRGELSTDAAFSLMDEIRRFGSPLVVLTGGDPLRRPDVYDIVSYGASLGLRVAVTPSATPDASREALARLKQAGVSRLAVSLDGSTAAIHDAFRQVPGSYDWTMQIMRWAGELEIPLQINTTVSGRNLEDFDAIAQLLKRYSLALWSVFFLVPTGRADLLQLPSARAFEKIFDRMAELSKTSPFPIKSTEAPQYRRVVLQHHRRAAEEGAAACTRHENGVPAHPILPVSDGKGFVFISHLGDVYPSGFLPVSGGNVKTASLVDVYRHSMLFRSLRDHSRLKGKCGACEFKTVCGGSRARAYAVHGDFSAADPFCTYVPKGYRIREEEKKFW